MRYFVAALLLHLALLAVVLVGVIFHPVRKPEPVIEAVLLRAKSPKTVAPKAEPVADTPKAEPQELPKPDPKPEQKAAEEKKLKEQQAEQQKQAEIQRKVDSEKALKLKQEKAQKEKEQQDKARAEAQKKLEEQARQKIIKDEENRRKQAEEKQQQQEDQQQLDELLNQEGAKRAAKARDVWARQITDKVRRNWIRPINSIEQFKCRLNVEILPGGSIANVKLAESCGNPMLDESVKRAVLKSDPLPMPSDPSVFERNLNFYFEPGTN